MFSFPPHSQIVVNHNIFRFLLDSWLNYQHKNVCSQLSPYRFFPLNNTQNREREREKDGNKIHLEIQEKEGKLFCLKLPLNIISFD